jgi:hypothetical protein
MVSRPCPEMRYGFNLIWRKSRIVSWFIVKMQENTFECSSAARWADILLDIDLRIRSLATYEGRTWSWKLMLSSRNHLSWVQVIPWHDHTRARSHFRLEFWRFRPIEMLAGWARILCGIANRNDYSMQRIHFHTICRRNLQKEFAEGICISSMMSQNIILSWFWPVQNFDWTWFEWFY